MASPRDKLADSLKVLETLQTRGVVAIRSSHLTRTHRVRLTKAGFLQEVMKGWYIPSRADDVASSAWFASFWDFCAAYLTSRFGDDWSMSPEQSLLLHTGNRAVPTQLQVRSPKARNRVTPLPHDCSLVESRASKPTDARAGVIDGIRVFSLPAALVATGPTFFRHNSTDARVALAMVPDASDVLSILLAGGNSVVAGRLAGAFRNIGRDSVADEILGTMRSADYDTRENDPFGEPAFMLSTGAPSPNVTRMRLTWQTMRETVVALFPKSKGRSKDTRRYLRTVDEMYVDDAYHSLSIEGYQVSPELIERVRRGAWAPDRNRADGAQRDAMAARGYHEAFQVVRGTIADVLRGKNPGVAVADDHRRWYRELFAPSVRAGILVASDLAGYRNSQVYIRKARHLPPRHEAVRDLMPSLFQLIQEETDPGVRSLLGHFMFVYIHPYMDGNGRMGRFLMNVMLAAGGYPWTVIPHQRRTEYLEGLEVASTESNIAPFAKFLANLVEARLRRMS